MLEKENMSGRSKPLLQENKRNSTNQPTEMGSSSGSASTIQHSMQSSTGPIFHRYGASSSAGVPFIAQPSYPASFSLPLPHPSSYMTTTPLLPPPLPSRSPPIQLEAPDKPWQLDASRWQPLSNTGLVQSLLLAPIEVVPNDSLRDGPQASIVPLHLIHYMLHELQRYGLLKTMEFCRYSGKTHACFIVGSVAEMQCLEEAKIHSGISDSARLTTRLPPYADLDIRIPIICPDSRQHSQFDTVLNLLFEFVFSTIHHQARALGLSCSIEKEDIRRHYLKQLKALPEMLTTDVGADRLLIVSLGNSCFKLDFSFVVCLQHDYIHQGNACTIPISLDQIDHLLQHHCFRNEDPLYLVSYLMDIREQLRTNAEGELIMGTDPSGQLTCSFNALGHYVRALLKGYIPSEEDLLIYEAKVLEQFFKQSCIHSRSDIKALIRFLKTHYEFLCNDRQTCTAVIIHLTLTLEILFHQISIADSDQMEPVTQRKQIVENVFSNWASHIVKLGYLHDIEFTWHWIQIVYYLMASDHHSFIIQDRFDFFLPRKSNRNSVSGYQSMDIDSLKNVVQQENIFSLIEIAINYPERAEFLLHTMIWFLQISLESSEPIVRKIISQSEEYREVFYTYMAQISMEADGEKLKNIFYLAKMMQGLEKKQSFVVFSNILIACLQKEEVEEVFLHQVLDEMLDCNSDAMDFLVDQLHLIYRTFYRKLDSLSDKLSPPLIQKMHRLLDLSKEDNFLKWFLPKNPSDEEYRQFQARIRETSLHQKKEALPHFDILDHLLEFLFVTQGSFTEIEERNSVDDVIARSLQNLPKEALIKVENNIIEEINAFFPSLNEEEKLLILHRVHRLIEGALKEHNFDDLQVVLLEHLDTMWNSAKKECDYDLTKWVAFFPQLQLLWDGYQKNARVDVEKAIQLEEDLIGILLHPRSSENLEKVKELAHLLSSFSLDAAKVKNAFLTALNQSENKEEKEKILQLARELKTTVPLSLDELMLETLEQEIVKGSESKEIVLNLMRSMETVLDSAKPDTYRNYVRFFLSHLDTLVSIVGSEFMVEHLGILQSSDIKTVAFLFIDDFSSLDEIQALKELCISLNLDIRSLASSLDALHNFLIVYFYWVRFYKNGEVKQALEKTSLLFRHLPRDIKAEDLFETMGNIESTLDKDLFLLFITDLAKLFSLESAPESLLSPISTVGSIFAQKFFFYLNELSIPQIIDRLQGIKGVYTAFKEVFTLPATSSKRNRNPKNEAKKSHNKQVLQLFEREKSQFSSQSAIEKMMISIVFDLKEPSINNIITTILQSSEESLVFIGLDLLGQDINQVKESVLALGLIKALMYSRFDLAQAILTKVHFKVIWSQLNGPAKAKLLLSWYEGQVFLEENMILEVLQEIKSLESIQAGLEKTILGLIENRGLKNLEEKAFFVFWASTRILEQSREDVLKIQATHILKQVLNFYDRIDNLSAVAVNVCKEIIFHIPYSEKEHFYPFLIRSLAEINLNLFQEQSFIKKIAQLLILYPDKKKEIMTLLCNRFIEEKKYVQLQEFLFFKDISAVLTGIALQEVFDQLINVECTKLEDINAIVLCVTQGTSSSMCHYNPALVRFLSHVYAFLEKLPHGQREENQVLIQELNECLFNLLHVVFNTEKEIDSLEDLFIHVGNLFALQTKYFFSQKELETFVFCLITLLEKKENSNLFSYKANTLDKKYISFILNAYLSDRKIDFNKKLRLYQSVKKHTDFQKDIFLIYGETILSSFSSDKKEDCIGLVTWIFEEADFDKLFLQEEFSLIQIAINCVNNTIDLLDETTKEELEEKYLNSFYQKTRILVENSSLLQGNSDDLPGLQNRHYLEMQIIRLGIFLRKKEVSRIVTNYFNKLLSLVEDEKFPLNLVCLTLASHIQLMSSAEDLIEDVRDSMGLLCRILDDNSRERLQSLNIDRMIRFLNKALANLIYSETYFFEQDVWMLEHWIHYFHFMTHNKAFIKKESYPQLTLTSSILSGVLVHPNCTVPNTTRVVMEVISQAQLLGLSSLKETIEAIAAKLQMWHAIQLAIIINGGLFDKKEYWFKEDIGQIEGYHQYLPEIFNLLLQKYRKNPEVLLTILDIFFSMASQFLSSSEASMETRIIEVIYKNASCQFPLTKQFVTPFQELFCCLVKDEFLLQDLLKNPKLENRLKALVVQLIKIGDYHAVEMDPRKLLQLQMSFVKIFVESYYAVHTEKVYGLIILLLESLLQIKNVYLFDEKRALLESIINPFDPSNSGSMSKKSKAPNSVNKQVNKIKELFERLDKYMQKLKKERVLQPLQSIMQEVLSSALVSKK